MGNNISGPTQRTGGALDSYVSELGADIIYEKSLGSSRFLKTVRGRHRNGPVVIKLFIKQDPGLSLRTYNRRLKVERETLADIPNVYNYQTFLETDKAGYIIRQYLANNLYDRISTRPFLSTIEKKWIAFQLLTGMRDARSRKIAHGDIKSQNILVTSWNWVYITDFASFKPVYLPEDDPTDFSFFFDTSGRRTCYLAPERFYAAGSEISKRKAELDFDKRDGKVTEAMDVFSLGCVIAELFLEGRDTFTLSHLFKYRAGELSMDSHLAAIEDEGVRSLVSRMIALDPSARPSFEELLNSHRETTFPESFYSFLHDYVFSINELSTPTPFTKNHGTPGGTMNDNLNGSAAWDSIPTDSDHRIERIWTEFDSVEPHLTLDNVESTVMERKAEYTTTGASSSPFHDVLPVELHIPNRSSKLRGPLMSGQRAASEDGPALVILSLICANIRNCTQPSSKVKALDLLLAVAPHLTDEAKLDRLVPYVVDLLHDDAALVRASAIRSLIQVLMLVTTITPSNAFIFPEYILPNVRDITRDKDVTVRCMYAQCIVSLADTSVRYLEMSQAIKAHGTFKLTDTQDYDDAVYEVSYDTSLQDLQSEIQDQLVTLMVDPASVVKRAVLHNISSLCVFFGRQKTNDVLLSHMITYLNDRDWLLRYAFFDSVVGVAAAVGSRSLEEYILPLMIQALSDVEETVVAKVLSSLTHLSEMSLFEKMKIWELMSASIPFLYHPNIWIRQGAASFISSAAKHLPATDTWCILYPSLKHVLRADIRVIDEFSLLSMIKSPLARQIFDTAMAWAMKGGSYWRENSVGRAKGTRMDSLKDGAASMKRSGALSPRLTSAKSQEDESQHAKLQALGMTSSEEAKLNELRDYIVKLARAMDSFSSRNRTDEEGAQLTQQHVELQKLGVVPQTVFLGLKDKDSKSPRIEPSRRPTRTSLLASPRGTRAGSFDSGARENAPFEDLRRRLAQMDGSSTSLNLMPPPPRPVIRRDSQSSVTSGVNSSATSDLSSLAQRLDTTSTLPSSENVLSGIAMSPSALRSKGILHLGGMDTQKASAAVGSVRTNATGLLEPPTKLHPVDENHTPSGRSSPLSAVGTVKADQASKPSSSNRPFSTTYEGQEPAVNHLLEHIYQDNSREALQDFGPRVHSGPIRRRTPARTGFSRENTSRSSGSTLVTHLNAHTGPINGIAVSPDHVFFISCSSDQSVKVWDTSRLERNITSKPRHSYTAHNSKVTCVCIIEGSHCFASAGEDGSIHVSRVHVSLSGTAPKYGKLQLVRQHQLDLPGEYVTCMQHFNSDTTSNLLYATSFSTITLLDLRSMRTLLTLSSPRHHGPITTLTLDRKQAWLITGTAMGTLTLWDLRFGLRLRSWKVGLASKPANEGGADYVRINQCVVHPTKGKGRWIIVGCEARAKDGATVVMEVWDIEKMAIIETFMVQEGGAEVSAESSTTPRATPAAGEILVVPELGGKEEVKSPAEAIAALVKARMAEKSATNGKEEAEKKESEEDDVFIPDPAANLSLHPLHDIRSLLTGSDFGGLGSLYVARGGHLDAVYPTTLSSTEKPGAKGYLISGGEDRKIRLWDLAKVERSLVVSGLEGEGERPSFKTLRTPTETSSYIESTPSTSTSLLSLQPAHRTSLITSHQQQLLKAHRDCITALACIDAPFRCGIVSGDRSGVLKVFRVEVE